MPYVGRDLSRGNYLKLDDLVSQFNGSKTTFNLTSGGSAFFPGSAFSILVSLGGIVQEPESAYTINKSQITFASAPLATDEFFIIALGVALGVGVPGHGTVGGSQLTKPLDYDDYFYLDSTNNRVGIHSSTPTVALDVIGDIKLNGNLVTSGTGGGGLNAGVVTCTGLDVNGNADFSGNVSIGGTLTYLDVTNIDSVGIITAQQGIHLGTASTVGHLSTVGVSSIASLQVRDLTATHVAYAGANGRLTGSSNLIFNGSDLLIDATTNAYKGVKFDNSFNLTFGSSSGTSPRLYLKGTSNSQSDAGDTFLGTGTGGEQWFKSHTFTAFQVDAAGTVKEALRLTAAGLVGINQSTPTRNLHIEGTAHQSGIIIHTAGNHSTAIDMDSNRSSAAGGLAELNFKWNGTTVGQIGAYAGSDTSNKDDGHIHFGTASAGSIVERLRITSGGDVLIGGHNTAIEPGGYESHLEIHGTGVDAGINVLRYSANAYGPTIVLGKSRGSSIGAIGEVQENDELGKINFYGTDTDWEPGASIRASADGEWYSGSVGSEDNTDAPGRLEFHTTPNGSDNLVEALRIGQNGFTTLNSGNGRTNACLVLTKADAGYAKLEFDVGTSQKAYVELDASEDLIHYGASGVAQKFYAGGSPRLNIASDGKIHTGNPASVATDDFNITSLGTGATLSLCRASTGNASDGDLLGAISFQSYPAGQAYTGAEVAIRAYAETGQSGSAAPSSLRFYTKPSTVGPGGSGVERLRLHPDGSITHNYGNPNGSATFKISKSGAGAAELRFDTATNNTASLYLGDDEQLRIRYGGTEHTRFASNGNIGIGTITPGEKLDVNGAIRLRASNWTTYAAKLYAALDSTHCVRLDAYHNSSTAFEVIGTHADSGGANVRVVIAKGGQKVGINNTNPSYQLEVTGSFAATTKSFVIDHPTKEKHKLIYACLEGPENSGYIRGRSSDPVIELPDYWVGLVHDDSITVNVTPIGNKNVWVESINNNSVTIGSDDSTEYFYTVFAERKDVEKLEVEVEK